ncbi:hypothetical protein AA0472_1135 [Acetobacter estunensis NRIC 0472]|uniref:DNA methyltransferase n=1 Tax=Acetobacter estunensis TaxID=104097 RepID=A0A967BA83_9PROT|nr:DNA adenine methylase [Acetobacter estunensis]NHO53298.1 hypothetical protein [Acetobacter estunensis]GBQ23545.1 hypothetical protein AA0472_1135 [Acetobacter estunensis NRIC 0472]
MKQRGDFALPPAAYVGGKKLLARRICAQIEAIPHRSYIEPFVGMGGVFFRRRVVAAHEVREVFDGFEMMDVATRYADRQSGGTGRVRGELVVSNRPLREV